MSLRNSGPKFAMITMIISLIILAGPALFAAEQTVEKTFDLNMDGKILLTNIAGNIHVSSWDKASVSMIAKKQADGMDDLNRITIDISDSPQLLRIETKYEKGNHRSNSGSVDYTLIIPEAAALSLRGVSSDFRIKTIGGEADFETISGDIKIEKAGGNLSLQTVSGEIHVIEALGNVDMKTVSGEIEINTLNGSVEGESVSGSVTLKGVSGARKVEAKSVSGDIVFYGKLLPDTTMSLSTHSGDVVVKLPADAQFNLETKTFSGETTCKFDLTMKGTMSSHKMNGKVGNGGPSVELSSFSGDILIDKE